MKTLQTVNIIESRLHDLVKNKPNSMAIRFAGGESWSWQDVLLKVKKHAASLQAVGVKQGDYVLSWMPNGPIAVLNLLALNYLGAIYVPVNTSYKGKLLEHVMQNSDASMMIAHGELVSRLLDVDLAKLKRLIVVGDERPALPAVELIGFSEIADSDDALQPNARAIAPSDTQMVVYTSGTTGPSKGVLSSYSHAYSAALGFKNIGASDCILVAMPMFHVGGIYGVLWALYHGACMVMAESFKTAEFWALVDQYKITTTGLLGSMVDFLTNLEPTEQDKQHSLKSVIIAPYTSAAIQFEQRFGVGVYTEYNMTELSVPMFIGPNPGVIGTCGKVVEGYELRLIDEAGKDVVDGESGELILRTKEAWQLSHGYHNNIEATQKTWRDGWFHTGDIFRRDKEGYYFFLDRAKDALRRRGENISSFEVEAAILLHVDVAEVAVVGVPADDGAEDEVLALIILLENRKLDPADLLDFLEPRLAHFMLPRYVRYVKDFPRTPTQKVEKHKLREEGITVDTWDRKQAGIVIKRDRLEQRG